MSPPPLEPPLSSLSSYADYAKADARLPRASGNRKVDSVVHYALCPFFILLVLLPCVLALRWARKVPKSRVGSKPVISDDGGVPFAPSGAGQTCGDHHVAAPIPPPSSPLRESGAGTRASVPRQLCQLCHQLMPVPGRCDLATDVSTTLFVNLHIHPRATTKDGPHPAESGRAHAVCEHVSAFACRAGGEACRRASDLRVGWKERARAGRRLDGIGELA